MGPVELFVGSLAVSPTSSDNSAGGTVFLRTA